MSTEGDGEFVVIPSDALSGGPGGHRDFDL